jgi:EAL domain-containing protein (putative c-di-GMP-specific phosphodiesterase class I)/GGDEF domain-containing protein
MFRRLQTKLSVLYGALFGILLAALGAATYGAINANVQRAIRGELVASGTVFDRLWALKSEQLHDSADLLARDFGFRAAVATHDAATTQSALDNLRRRLGLDKAFIVGLDASVTGLDASELDDGADKLWTALDQADGASGVLMIHGQPYQAISAPVLAPTPAGWVVFAVKLDRNELSSLERLSAAPLKASLLTQRGHGPWQVAGVKIPAIDAQSIDRFASPGQTVQGQARRLNLVKGDALALIKPLKTLGSDRQAALLIRYPLATALAPYKPMLATVAMLGVVSMAVLLAGSGLLARGLSRPLMALDEAAHRLARGEDAYVEVLSSDEVGRLAASFNSMAAEIGERERRIFHLALHDAETDLPNRRALIQRLEALAAEGDEGVVVSAALGVERFALVRSAIGYGLVGALLKELAARLTEQRPDLKPARIATGILGVAFRARDMDDAAAIVAGLIHDLEHPVRLGATAVDVGVAAGLAALGAHADNCVALVERANIALDQSRERRRKVVVFDQAAYGDPVSNLTLMSEMLRAAASGDMVLHYQPKLDLRTGAIRGAEALCRWRHPVRGMLSPDLFVGMAEETGHIRALTDWVLGRAIADSGHLRRAGLDMMLSVNISGRLMGDVDFANQAIARIVQSGAKMCFEITETAVIDNPGAALGVIEAYAAAGIPISIDDYGSGLSSLAYLKQIAAQELKIDKAFVVNLAAGQREALLVKSTVDLAHALGLKVVAEGVETAEGLALLQSMGCDMAQGYHIAKPMTLAALLDFLAAHPTPLLKDKPGANRRLG